MSGILRALNAEATSLQRRLVDSLIEENRHNSDLNLEGLIKRLAERRDQLSLLTNVNRLAERDGERIHADNLNECYASIVLDLYSLYGAGNQIGDVLSRYKVVTAERNNRLESAVQAEEGRITGYQFLKDRPWNLEAFDQPLAENKTTSDRAAVFNSFDKSLSLAAVSSSSVNRNAKVEVKFLGNPDRQTLPSYQIDKVFDQSKLTGWYEIVGFQTRPRYLVDFKQNSPVLSTLSSLTKPVGPDSGSSTSYVYTNPRAYSVGDKITLGDIFASNTEELTVIKIENNGLVTSPVKFRHFVGDEIYPGTDVRQVSGAVALIDFTFQFPERINFMRLIPFSSQPQKIHGVYYSVRSDVVTWVKIPDSEVLRLRNGKAFTFDQKIAKKLRIIIEQTNSEYITRAVSAAAESENTAWELIYETEYDTRLPDIERKLEMYTGRDIIEANARDERGFLARKNVLDNIRSRVYQSTGGSTQEEVDQELNVLSEFISGKDHTEQEPAVTYISKHVYEMGLLEVELFNNVYRPASDFLGPVITPKQSVGTYSLISIEGTDANTSVKHYITLNSGEDIPIINQANISSAGEIISKNELLEVDPATRTCYLNFRPFNTTITITKTGADIQTTTFQLDVPSSGLIAIPATKWDQKAVFQTTYPVAEPDVDLVSNTPSEIITEESVGTTDGSFLELPSAPYIAPGIVNDVGNWVRRSRTSGIWDFITPTANNAIGNYSWVDSAALGKCFPSDGLIIDDEYFGRECLDPIQRTPALEAHLASILAEYSGDINTRIERFFNRYIGKVLSENLTYEPIIVTVDGQRARNLSSYDGSPDSGFLSSLGDKEQFRQFSNRIQFPSELPNKIAVTYRRRASTVQYHAQLLCNKKSQFFTSPMLKSAMLVTSI